MTDRPSRIVAALAALVVVLAALCTYLACANVARGQSSTEDVDGTVAVEKSEFTPTPFVSYDPKLRSEHGVKTPYTYSTALGAITLVTYPSFSFSFPVGWSVKRELVEQGLEQVELQKGASGLIVSYAYGQAAFDSSNVHLVTIKKVADSAFWPDYVQSTDHTDLGPFMVAEVVLGEPNADGEERTYTCYAVLPESALRRPDSPGMDIAFGVPSFRYSGPIAFWSRIPHEGITDDEREEVIAILSSFTNGTTEEEYRRIAEASAAQE